MSPWRRSSPFALACALALATCGQGAAAQNLAEDLYARAVLAGKCKQATRSVRQCDFVFGRTLSFSIKDVGGADPIITFSYSNANEELYAIYLSGCVAVVPGIAYPPFDEAELGVYVSPKTGRVYQARAECLAARALPAN